MKLDGVLARGLKWELLSDQGRAIIASKPQWRHRRVPFTHYKSQKWQVTINVVRRPSPTLAWPGCPERSLKSTGET